MEFGRLLKNFHDCKEGNEAAGWFAKFSKIDMDYSGDPEGKVGVKVLTPYTCVKTAVVPAERKQYSGAYYYYPGRGLTLTWQGILMVLSHRLQYAEGTLTVYYW